MLKYNVKNDSVLQPLIINIISVITCVSNHTIDLLSLYYLYLIHTFFCRSLSS